MFVLRLQQMRPLPLVLASAALLSLFCNRPAADPQSEWRAVLAAKKAAEAQGATPRQKQLYADALRAFLDRHPTHGRGRVVYQRIQLDFARELASHGRYQDAIRFYRSVLERDPGNQEAARGVAGAVERLAISREKLLSLEKGMTQHQVAQILGKPIPGWAVRNDRREPVFESWYYRTVQGTVAGVYFRNGKVFAAEVASNARVAAPTR